MMPVNATTQEVRDARKLKEYLLRVKQIGKRPARKIYAVNLSRDHGETWQVKALCVECIKEIEPPARVRRSIEAGTRTCDFCNCLNKLYQE